MLFSFQDRGCFQEATAHCPGAKSRKLQPSVEAVCRALATRAAFRRSLDLALFPIADLLLFVAPTFHAHATMAINADSFVYEVAPKGGNSNSTSSLSLSSMASSSSTQDLQQQLLQEDARRLQKSPQHSFVQLPSFSRTTTSTNTNNTNNARVGELSPLLSSVPVQPTAGQVVGSYGSHNHSKSANPGSVKIEAAVAAAAPAKPLTVRVVA